MRKVVGLIAFCCMVAGTGMDAEAASSFDQIRMKELEKDPTVQEYIKLSEKEKSSSVRKRNRRAESVSEAESGDSDSDTPRKKKKRKKKKNKKQSVRNSVNDSMAYNESDNQTMIDGQNSNQTVSNKKKKRRKKKKNKKNQAYQMNQMDQMNMMDQDQVGQMNQMGQMDMMNQNQVNQTNQMGQMNMMDQNRSNRTNQMNQMGQMNMMNQNRSNRTNQMNPMEQMNNIDSDDEFALNEPIIDGTKIKKSSMIVEKDIKLASNNETKKVEKKIAPINLSPLDKEKVLAQVNSGKDVKLVANFDAPDLKIKEKLQQVNNNRKTYNLIRTPNKKLKDNIQVNKFRAELDHYRKLYSANSKNA